MKTSHADVGFKLRACSNFPARLHIAIVFFFLSNLQFSKMGNEVSAEAMYQSGRSYRVIPIRKREKKPLPEPDFGKASVVNKPNPLDRKLEKRREEQKQKELEEFVKEALKIHNEYRWGC